MGKSWEAAADGMGRADASISKIDPGWRDGAMQSIYDTALRCRFLIIDDVHDQLKANGFDMPTPLHGCCLGALMTKARKQGYIEATGKFRRSGRITTHVDLRPVWKSLIFDPNAPAIALVENVEPRMCRTCGGTRKVENGVCVVCRLEASNL